MMNLDEAIQHYEEVADSHDFIKQIKAVTLEECRCASEHRQLAEWLKELKAYKEQSDDCISRQEALYAITMAEVRWQAVDNVNKLPPVTPQTKTGHWIRMKAYEKWGCSECNTVFRFTFKEHDYCPNCGVKMEGVEE